VCVKVSARVGCAADHPAPAEDEAAAGDEAPKSPVEDDKAIVFKLYELLRAADMEVRHTAAATAAATSTAEKGHVASGCSLQLDYDYGAYRLPTASCVVSHLPFHLYLLLQTTSEKALRKQLQQFFKTDMGEKKAFIKEHVRGALAQHGGSDSHLQLQICVQLPVHQQGVTACNGGPCHGSSSSRHCGKPAGGNQQSADDMSAVACFRSTTSSRTLIRRTHWSHWALRDSSVTHSSRSKRKQQQRHARHWQHLPPSQLGVSSLWALDLQA
jgi:hypothetical protein